jgi:DNA repair exonuclease SbcCD nuclease subunit
VLVEIYGKLERFNLPVFALQGNHEARYWRNFGKAYNGNFVRLLREAVIKVVPGNGTRNIVLGHDLSHNMHVHEPREVRQWFQLLRTLYANIIEPDAMFVLGHVHQRRVATDGLTFTVKPFSVDLCSYQYAIIEFNQEKVLDVIVHDFDPK